MQTAHARRTLGFLLRESSRLMRRRFVHHARKARLPLNLSAASLLSQVWREPGIRQVRIACLLDLETISVVRLVDSLQQAGLLERRPHPTNRRVMQLHPTEAGLALVELSQAALNEAHAGLFEALSGDDEAVLGGLLRRLVQHTNPEALDLSRPRPE